MVCYIILHFQVIEETINCVNQIRGINGKHKIIIVDNCSPNGSGKQLDKVYHNAEDVEVILHCRNDGFARGNNIGCAYAKEKYNPDFYVVMNNDIEIVQKNFESLLYTIYEEACFDVLGPDIYSTTLKMHQSPKSLQRTTISASRILQQQYEKKINSKVTTSLRCYLKKIKFLKKMVHNNAKAKLGVDYTKKHENVPLHGSCVIFSNSFIQSRKSAFFPGTFFYYEMEILDYECQAHGFKEVYDPRIKVFHHQNISTNATFKSDLKKVRFMNQQNYKSISAFLEEYDGE